MSHVFNVKDYGAVGDGTTDDTTAFQNASAAVRAAGGGVMVIPPGNYKVGRQSLAGQTGLEYAYRPEPIIDVSGVRRVEIVGYGARIFQAAGQRYGNFDPVTGQPHNADFNNVDRRAALAAIILCIGAESITVRGLDLDGNAGGLLLGGPWGDNGTSGRQVTANGLHLYGNGSVHVEDCRSHHHALDGMEVGFAGRKPENAITPCTIVNSQFDYNGRQGVSWVGGRGFVASGCSFSHTGRGRPGLQTSPGAGFDFEAEDSHVGQASFIACEFVNNSGPGMVADTGSAIQILEDLSFERCRFWGTTFYSVWPRRPGIVFRDCDIFGALAGPAGNVEPERATRFYDCRIEDRAHPDHGVFRGNATSPVAAIIEGGGQNVLLERCTIKSHVLLALYLENVGTILRDCTVVHAAASRPAGTRVAFLRNTRVERTTFMDATGLSPTPPWFVEVDAVDLRDRVELPSASIRWQSPSGPSGTVYGPVQGSTIQSSGAVQGSTVVASGAVQGATVVASGAVQGATVVASGAVQGATVQASGAVQGSTVVASGAVQGATVQASGAVLGSTVQASGAVQGSTVVASGAVQGSTVQASGAVQGATVQASGNGSFGGTIHAAPTLASNTVALSIEGAGVLEAAGGGTYDVTAGAFTGVIVATQLPGQPAATAVFVVDTGAGSATMLGEAGSGWGTAASSPLQLFVQSGRVRFKNNSTGWAFPKFMALRTH